MAKNDTPKEKKLRKPGLSEQKRQEKGQKTTNEGQVEVDENVEQTLDAIGDAEALQESLTRTQKFAESNSRPILIGLAVIVLVVAGALFWQYTQQNAGVEAQNKLFPAIFYLEKDSVGTALNGDMTTTPGFEGVAKEFGSSNAGNTAKLFAAVAHMKEERYDQAIGYLKDYSGSDNLTQARAYALLGDCYMQKEDASTAAGYYRQAAEYKPNKQFTPLYLIKLGLAQEAAGNTQAAKDAYQKVIDEYSKSQDVSKAKMRLGMLIGAEAAAQ